MSISESPSCCKAKEPSSFLLPGKAAHAPGHAGFHRKRNTLQSLSAMGTPGKLNPSHVTGSHSSSSPGSPYKTLQFSCGFRELPAPQSEWLRIRGPGPSSSARNRAADAEANGQTGGRTPDFLSGPSGTERPGGQRHRPADSASNTASIQLKTNEERTTLSCEAEFPSSASIQGFAILDSSGLPIPGLRRAHTPEITEHKDGKTSISCLHEMEEGAGKPSPSLPRELNLGVVYLPRKHSLDVPIDLAVNPSLSPPSTPREAVNNHESGLSAQPSPALQVKLYNWVFHKEGHEPVFLGIYIHTDKNHALLNDMEQQGAQLHQPFHPRRKNSRSLPGSSPHMGHFHLQYAFFPSSPFTASRRQGMAADRELRVPAGEVRTTPARTISAEPGKQWAIDVPGASGDYPPFQVQATLLSIKPSAKEFRATFKLKGHHGNPHFSGLPCGRGHADHVQQGPGG